MKITKYIRKFIVSQNITITERGQLVLENDEQILLSNGEDIPFEVCAKDWGYYIGGSLDQRMKSYGKILYLCQNSKEQRYLLLVNEKQRSQFLEYLKLNEMTVMSRL
jgi:hypothetical protein